MEASENPPSRKRRITPITLAIGAVVTLAVLAGAFLAVAQATDSPQFCGSACHEMGPYHAAWTQGAHRNVPCVDCHVDQGVVARAEHKVVALRQLVDHLKGATEFPLATEPDVPDSRCLRCHSDVRVNIAGFSHADHAKRGPCIKCHADAGHNVTPASLKQAGVLNVAYMRPAATATSSVAPSATATSVPASAGVVAQSAEASALPGAGKADIPGHLPVGCSNCHDLATTGCSACHSPGPGHANRPKDCSLCHAAGAKFVFTHPARTDCGSCHQAPPGLKPPHPARTDCTTCHVSGPGADWKFTHPQIQTCGTCHTVPADHKWSDSTCTDCHKAGPGKSFAFTHPSGSGCTTCHQRPTGGNPPHPARDDCSACHRRPGVAWTFAHPSNGANCASCHNRPSGHRSGTCATCHQNAGRSWAFAHPNAGASCASCHNRPSGHRGGACQSCHRNAGRNWAFSHPGQAARCSSCHSAPSKHYGTSCGSCHNAGGTWANAHFSHPKIPYGSPHTYKSFACAKCHPSGPPAYFCTCHGTTTGPKDD